MSSFEVRRKDLMGRTGRLDLGDHEVATPALMPVVNPHYGIPDLDDARIAITNAHILRESDDHHDTAVEDGVHAVLGFDGPVVTDSGSFQLSVYGDDEVDATNEEILAFQDRIGTDVGTPLDLPTDPDAPRDVAEDDVEVTLDRIAEAVDRDTGFAVNAPVQGAIHTGLRRNAAERAAGLDGDVYPIGGVVPLMQQYRYAELVDVVMAAKQGLGHAPPVHLFGAGHPMIFGLAVAMGCDLFDSAAYAIYAHEGRYLTPNGTHEIEELTELPCSCEACRDREPDALVDDPDTLADHNLATSFAEMRRVRDALRRGALFEHLERRCRAHPALLDGLRRFAEHAGTVERVDPATKATPFYLGTARRPAVIRHHDRLDRIEVGDAVTVTACKTEGRDDLLLLNPPFGPFPPALVESYPFNAETPEEPDHAALATALEGVERLVALNPDADVTLEHPGWSHPKLDDLADAGVTLDDTSHGQEAEEP